MKKNFCISGGQTVTDETKIGRKTQKQQYRNINMTYTTEEKRKIAELRHNSKMNTLNQIAQAEGDYNKATATHKATLDRKIAEYELKAGNILKTDIAAALTAMRTDEIESAGDEIDE